MGSFNRGGSGGFRGGYQSRGRSSFGGDRGEDRPMYKAICSNCGKECEVPFRPTNGKPVYCSECFEKMGGRRADSRPERSDFRGPAPSFDQNKSQLDAINSKLDRLLNLLEPKVVAPPAPASVVSLPVVEEVKEIEAKKPKKVVKKSSSAKKK